RRRLVVPAAGRRLLPPGERHGGVELAHRPAGLNRPAGSKRASARQLVRAAGGRPAARGDGVRGPRLGSAGPTDLFPAWPRLVARRAEAGPRSGRRQPPAGPKSALTMFEVAQLPVGTNGVTHTRA